ncbi:MAG: bifunctional glutamine-synthetase adenylyltransferase/deadenyltransferase, partial [Microbacterium sp.]|nr:bifunctional glutamine-synthetase adenylyltransferase/deadenyltransferase [Microbacterium sp.]
MKREVRDIHVRLFYRPLLSAVAALPEGERSLSTGQAHDRLAAIGFQDPAGALRHIGALTGGLSRKATIQRHLMPVMIRWFADGVDPDYGLLSFRRISERLGDTPWFLRLLRDSSAAAESLTRALSGSRYIGELMEWIPESAAWLDDDELLRPRSGRALEEEARAIQARHDTIEEAMRSVRGLRRRELLRTAMAAVLGVLTIEELADALTTISEVTIQATLRAVRREIVPPEDEALDFAVIAMGRFGLESYAEYYGRWSLSWEAQALLRARGVAGSVKLIREFETLADSVRYPARADAQGLREIRRIKARVETERLQKGVDPARHLKLGPG